MTSPGPDYEYVAAYTGDVTVDLIEGGSLFAFAQLYCQELPRENEPINPDWNWYALLSTTAPADFLGCANAICTIRLPDGRTGQAMFPPDATGLTATAQRSGPFPQ